MRLLLTAVIVAVVVWGTTGTSQFQGNYRSALALQPSADLNKMVAHDLDVSGKGVANAVAANEYVNTLELMPLGVIGSDDRWRVSPTTFYPARTVTFLYMGFASGAASCSGVFIGSAVVLTAAHCLYNPDAGGWPNSIAVVPGKDGNVDPYGFQFAANASVTTGWLNGLMDTEYDWGLVRLPNSTLGNTVGWLTIGALSTTTLQRPDFQPTLVGYPSDKPAGTQWAGNYPNLFDVQPNKILFLIDTYQGQSGGPVWRYSDALVVGALSRELRYNGVPVWNEAPRVTIEVINSFVNMCQTWGCAVSYYIEPPATPAPTPTRTHTRTPTPTRTPTITPTPSNTPTPMNTPTPTNTPVAQLFIPSLFKHNTGGW